MNTMNHAAVAVVCNVAAEWKRLWMKAEQLMGQSGELAFERATLIVGLFNNQEFRSDCACRRVSYIDELDRLCDGMNMRTAELRAMLEHYPQKDQWSSGRLRRMYDDMVKAKMPPKNRPKPSPIEPQFHGQIVREEDRGEPDRIKALEEENERLREENQKLRGELRRIKSTVESLELA